MLFETNDVGPDPAGDVTRDESLLGLRQVHDVRCRAGEPACGLEDRQPRTGNTVVDGDDDVARHDPARFDPGRGKPDDVSDPEMLERIKQYLPGEEITGEFLGELEAIQRGVEGALAKFRKMLS